MSIQSRGNLSNDPSENEGNCGISFSYKLPSLTENVWEGCEVRFLDSMCFMLSSLDKLAENSDNDKMNISRDYYSEFEISTSAGSNKNNDVFKTMRKKGIYPYEYSTGHKECDNLFFDDNFLKTQLFNSNFLL
ncbi:hypothetical protein L3Y34_001530 [Caenorhabditis briggsae]|uniref:Uncharacterized protein n=1 Tax=Caenorhabditis briggsae TaxID=6238 RepID=A0AAE9IQ25_CAEBR|nr:hypothetical protein L3Y34_001530 [Caenorhabditis briggsae]